MRGQFRKEGRTLNHKFLFVVALSNALIAVCSCADQEPTRPPGPTSATVISSPSAKTMAGRSQQAVWVHLKLSGSTFGTAGERGQLATLEDELAHAITAAGVGELDGNEVGEGEYTLYMYGPDAPRLADVVRPIVARVAARGSNITIRAGSPGAPEAREELISFTTPAVPGSPLAAAPSASPPPPASVAPGSTGGTDIVIPKGFDVSLVGFLACPENKSPVRLATRRELDEINAKITQGDLRQRDGSARTKRVEALLIRQDAMIGYEIENGVPVMLVDRGIVLQPGAVLPDPAARDHHRR